VQFAVFEALYTRWEGEGWAMQTLPGSHGLQLRVLAAAVSAASCRAVLECPIGGWVGR
jgi:hypothetical protein